MGPAASGAVFDCVNPYSLDVWARVADGGVAEVDRAVAAARRARRARGRMTARTAARRAPPRRADPPRRGRAGADRDPGQRQAAARDGRADAALPDWYHYFAEAADKLVGDVIPTEKTNFLVYTMREPVGVVAAITAWNSPLLLATFKVAPALAAGCTCVIKPAEQTPVSTLALAALVEEAGFPPGVVNVVVGDGPTSGARLVRHPGVDRVSFTGSTAVGMDVARGAADHVARVSLELGGKSPNIVFADADLDAALNGAVAGIFAATGQTCLAGSRLFVQRPVFDELVGRLADARPDHPARRSARRRDGDGAGASASSWRRSAVRRARRERGCRGARRRAPRGLPEAAAVRRADGAHR